MNRSSRTLGPLTPDFRFMTATNSAHRSGTVSSQSTYLDFLDGLLNEEVEAKHRTRVAMGIQIAHFPGVKTLEDFDYKAQPSVDQRLVKELLTGRYVAPQALNTLK